MEKSFLNLKGKFSLKTYKNKKLIDVYQDDNLIMDTGRITVANLLGGNTSVNSINKIKIGNKGYDEEQGKNIPLIPGENGFTRDRTNLFSEEQNCITYEVSFDPYNALNTKNIIATGKIVGADLTEEVNVTREITNNQLKYTLIIDESKANPVEGDYIAFTEAGLYSDQLFAMKTFPARIKESTVSFLLEWVIYF